METTLDKLLNNRDLLSKIVKINTTHFKVSVVASKILHGKFVMTFEEKYRTQKKKHVWYTLYGTQWVRDDKKEMLQHEMKTMLRDYIETVLNLLRTEEIKLVNEKRTTYEWIHFIDLHETRMRLHDVLDKLRLQRYVNDVIKEMEGFLCVRHFRPENTSPPRYDYNGHLDQYY